jgi:hypothetical protein
MKKNVGNSDKIVRVILALVAAYFAYTKVFDPSWITYVLYGVSILLLFTVLMSSCPCYSVFGKSTCKVDYNN